MVAVRLFVRAHLRNQSAEVSLSSAECPLGPQEPSKLGRQTLASIWINEGGGAQIADAVPPSGELGVVNKKPLPRVITYHSVLCWRAMKGWSTYLGAQISSVISKPPGWESCLPCYSRRKPQCKCGGYVEKEEGPDANMENAYRPLAPHALCIRQHQNRDYFLHISCSVCAFVECPHPLTSEVISGSP